MKRLDIKNYSSNLGPLIDIQNPIDYNKYHYPGSINIPYEKLLLNYKTYLTKDKSYYIVCKKGTKSRKAVAILEFYGYDVTQMSYE